MKSGNNKAKQTITAVIMKADLQQKHHQKRKLKCEMIKLSTQLKSYFSNILLNAVIYSLDKSIKQKAETIDRRHHKKFIKLRRTKVLFY